MNVRQTWKNSSSKREIINVHRCLAIGSLANFEMIKGMLLVHVALLFPKLDIISRIYFLVQGDIKN